MSATVDETEAKSRIAAALVRVLARSSKRGIVYGDIIDGRRVAYIAALDDEAQWIVDVFHAVLHAEDAVDFVVVRGGRDAS